MIPKKISGRGPAKGNFLSCLDYLLKTKDKYDRDKKPTIIASNMGGRTKAELAAEFREIQSNANRRGDPVWHVSLAAHPSEHFTDQQWALFAEDLINRVGRLADPKKEVGISTDSNQYVVIRHHNEEHEHVHILLNRVNFEGKTCYCNWSIKTLHAACAELEREYGLVQCDHSKSQREGKKKHSSLSPQAVERLGEKETKTGTPDPKLEKERSHLSVTSFLQQAIDSATADSPTMSLLLMRLLEQGIDAKIAYTRTGKIKGISYAVADARFTGTDLGAHYTFQGLQKHKGVHYEKDQDTAKRLLSEKPPKPHQHFVEEPTQIKSQPSPAAIELSNDLPSESLLLPSTNTQEQHIEPTLPAVEPVKAPQNLSSKQRFQVAQDNYLTLWLIFQQAKVLGKTKKIEKDTFCYQDKKYAFVFNEKNNRFSVVHIDRGELARYQSGKLKAVKEISLEDIEAFAKYSESRKQPLHNQPPQSKPHREKSQWELE